MLDTDQLEKGPLRISGGDDVISFDSLPVAELYAARTQAHEHEWKLWEDIDLAEGKSLIPGVITNSSVLVEHPELVAMRLENFASAVGKENVIAGGDCGFASFATSHEIHPEVVWAKLEAMVEGARIASNRLW